MKILRLLFLGGGLLAAGLPSLAATEPGDGPRDLVIETTDKILGKIREQRVALDANPRLVDQFIIEIVLPHFDFVAMSRSVLGKHWRRASQQQQQSFVAEFKNLLVRTYATALLEYTEERIEFLPLNAVKGDDDVTVRTEIEQPGGLGIPIDYRMELQSEGWKVYDVTIDGLSLVGNYRNTFNNEVRQVGLDGLIDNIRQRNVDARAG
jgi:phospholipid transport system substrate-binding protein